MITYILCWFIVAGVLACLGVGGKQDYLTGSRTDIEEMPSDTAIIVVAALWPIALPVYILVTITDYITRYQRF